MSGLEDRVREVVEGSFEGEQVTIEGLARAFNAVARLLEESFDLPTPDPAAAAPGRELPTEVGSVILISGYAGQPVDPPLAAVLDIDGTWFDPTEFVDSDRPWLDGARIAPWVAARVVPDEGTHAPVVALREVLRISREGRDPMEHRMGQVEFAAREALKALGEVPGE